MGRQGKEGQRTGNFVGWLANRDTVCMCIVHEIFPVATPLSGVRDTMLGNSSVVYAV